MAHSCYICGMSRTRISTTVDERTLDEARALDLGTDSVMMDAALRALLAAHRATEIDDAYAIAYDRDPIDGDDEWGNIETFRAALHTQRQRPAARQRQSA